MRLILLLFHITLLAADGPFAPGSLRFKWISGSICAATNRDPRIQVVMYNEDTYILRENIALHYDAPFTYLLFGSNGALLIDTGATAEPEYYPLRATVQALLKHWGDIHGKSNVPLTIALTSPEYLSQNQGLKQFNTPIATGETIDLGGRVITMIPTPGTHKDGVTFYDPYNGFLYTGDFLFPGRIMIANDKDYLSSITRLKEFASQHPVKWVMGGQIDMSFLPGVEYMRLIRYKPHERVLQLEPAAIDEAFVTATRLYGKADVAIRVDFTMRNRVGPDHRPATRPSDLPPIPTMTPLR